MPLQTRMERALLDWAEKPNGEPDGHLVCHLIESHDLTETVQDDQKNVRLKSTTRAVSGE
jgi:hypothetical protein